MKDRSSPIFTPRSAATSLSSSSSRRTNSFSSSSSSSSTSSSTPSSPHQPQPPTSGIPFSWEHHPGIPKHPIPTPPTPPHLLLPLPPPLTKPKKSKPKKDQPFSMDPFTEALFECSKDDMPEEIMPCLNQGPKVGRSVSDRFGFGFGFIDRYSSCKMACAADVVATSHVLLLPPRSQRDGATYDELLRLRRRL
ncbi:hypothetical protein QJS10_CPA08g01121 [Acorus calamus]|uniref:Uncharacterized protein n=1 Tax=Acorus calamus TaxID=4465 RepID=A0AAV9E9F5_ACOCL|nr:hypothetical protein QJS10_CPA08g01121 [Acorus calamus]